MKNKYTLEYIEERGLILFKAVVGSKAYGTNVETSDTDYCGVYICELEDLYSGEFPDQINDEKNDMVFYEIKRFLQLLQTANPTVLSILFSPEDCIIYKHPIFDIILNKRQEFVTKSCKNSFAGYAIAQCKKAKGLDKMQNWEKDKVTRKDILDFCYVIDESGYGTILLKKFLKDRTMEQQFCGISKIPNARDLYALFYDQKAHYCFSKLEEPETNKNKKKYYKKKGESVGLGYKGISKIGTGESVSESNQLRLSSIPKGEKTIATLIFNKDSYIQSNKDYKSYQTWIQNRNEQRYVDNLGHNQKIDGKNIMHLVRLLRMSREIAENGEFIIRRPDAEYLKSIRRGEVSLQDIIDWAEEEILVIDDLFLNSDLPDKVEREFVNDLLVQIRVNIYKTT